jgi:hypothetical protein
MEAQFAAAGKWLRRSLPINVHRYAASLNIDDFFKNKFGAASLNHTHSANSNKKTEESMPLLRFYHRASFALSYPFTKNLVYSPVLRTFIRY